MEKEKRNGIKILFMIPLRRCGSHAIRLRLNMSEEFYSPYPLHIIDILNKVNIKDEELLDDNKYKKLIELILGLEEKLFFRWFKEGDISVDKVFEAIKNDIRNIHKISEGILLQSASLYKPKAKIIMDKSLDCINYAEDLINIYGEDAKFLNIVRDPRAQINSMNQAIIHDFSTISNTLTWLNAYNKANYLINKFPNNVLTITFEEFLMNQEETLKKICKFNGIEFKIEMMEIKKSDEAKIIHSKSALWKSNYSDPILENIDKFKKSLSYYDLEIIETLTEEFMNKYNYKRLTNENIKLTEDEINKAKDDSLKNKEKLGIC